MIIVERRVVEVVGSSPAIVYGALKQLLKERGLEEENKIFLTTRQLNASVGCLKSRTVRRAILRLAESGFIKTSRIDTNLAWYSILR